MTPLAAPLSAFTRDTPALRLCKDLARRCVSHAERHTEFLYYTSHV
jgi:hypothetical protein